MFRYLICASLFMVSGFVFSDDVLSPSAKFEQLNENDKQIINQFCTEYKANVKKAYDLVNNANVSSSTFALFEINTRSNLVPANLQFLKEFKNRGAENCTGF